MRFLPILLILLSKLPLRALYVFADALCILFQYVIRYRRRIIENNLSHSFPEKTKHEIKALTSQYYKHLCDVMVETIRLQSMGANELKKRCKFVNPEILTHYDKNNRNVMIMMGHCGNWEWAGCATELQFNFTVLPIYRKLKNKPLDGFYRSLRSKFGSIPIKDKDAFAEISKHKSHHAVAVLADQTPGAKKGWWINFLNQPTPFFRGSEILAQRLGYEVVFAQVRKLKRGYYSIELTPYNGDANERFHVTKSFAQFLESEIEKQPFNWLWSHKRWKHKPKDNAVWMTKLPPTLSNK